MTSTREFACDPGGRLDTTRAEPAFGFRAGTDLANALARTVDWYRAHMSANECAWYSVGKHEASHKGPPDAVLFKEHRFACHLGQIKPEGTVALKLTA